MSKYRWFTFPKHRYPTKFVEGGTTQYGSTQAMKKLVQIVGQDRADNMIKSHTKGLWRWGEIKEPTTQES